MKTPERTPQRTTEEIKRGLEICLAFPTPKDGCNRCPYISERRPTGICRTSLKNDAIVLIQQLESSYSQVGKALCGTENATLEEVLRAVEQVKQTKPGERLICEISIPAADILRKAVEEVELDGKTLVEWFELLKVYKQLEVENSRKDDTIDNLTELLNAAHDETAAVKRERDAAVSTVKDCCGCEKCDHYTGTEEHIEAICLSCEDKCHFEMRGMKGLPVTPEDFLAKVESLYDNGRDPEVFHDKTDTLMEDILIAFGYQKGIEFLRSKVRWSA